jgi:HK97 family phage major capsid protein
MPDAPPVTTGSFQRVLHPDQVARIVNMLLEGSPFAGALTRYPTNRARVAFPTAAPDKPAWTAEGAPLPVIGMNDDADIVAVAKLGEVILLSNESWADASVNLTSEFSTLLRDAAGPELDRGLLYGEVANNEPRGVVARATAAPGADMAAALTAAIGSIGDAGGSASVLAAPPAVLAAQRNTRGTPDGQRLFPDGIGAAFGLTEVPVPTLAAGDILVIDASRAFTVVRSDFEVAVSSDYAFHLDSTAMRVKGRFAVACPSVDKALRKLTIGGTQAAARK